MGEDTQKTQDFTEAHPGNTSLHGEYTVNGASGLDELYVKDNDLSLIHISEPTRPY